MHMNSFWNFLKKNKLYGAVNLVGLTVSMTFVLLLAVYIEKQLSTDSFQENADRIYVVANEESISSGYWQDKHLRNNFPEIEKSCCVAHVDYANEFNIENKTVYASMTAADSTFFDIFSYRLAKGNKEDWKISSDRCMASEEFANAHFIDEDPIGKTMTLNVGNGFELTVCGVYKDFGNSVLSTPDVLCRGEIMPRTNSANDERMSNAGSGVCFVMTWPGADLNARHDGILTWLENNYWIYDSKYDEVRLIPLRDIYFLKDGKSDWSETIHFGNRDFVDLLPHSGFLR